MKTFTNAKLAAIPLLAKRRFDLEQKLKWIEAHIAKRAVEINDVIL